MSTNGNPQLDREQTQGRIMTLLQGMPDDSLNFIEQLVSFMSRRDGPPPPSDVPYRYPTVALPASSLKEWVGVLETGYEGDALADTEALYDDV